MTATLVPCPLCGADTGYSLLIGMHYRWRTIACFSCGAEIGETHTTYPVDHESLAQSADDAWNSAGAHAQGLREENARLRAALNAMLTQFGMDEDEWSKPTFNQARAALAKEPK